MRVRDLRQLLQKIEQACKVLGARGHQAGVSSVVTALEPHGNADLGTFLRAVETELDVTAEYIRRLKEAGFREAAFKTVLAELEDDRQLKKADLALIAEGYTGSANHKAPAKRLLKHIKAHFYAKLYERDANEMAKRATPV